MYYKIKSDQLEVDDLLEEQKMLRDARLKVTPQRTAILRLLRDSKEHPGVEKVYRMVLQEFPSVSLATIYKTLELFKDKGLIQEVAASARKVGYDGNPDFHPHLICTGCKKIVDMHLPEASIPEVFFQEAKQTHGFQVTNHQLFLFGLCPGCQS